MGSWVATLMNDDDDDDMMMNDSSLIVMDNGPEYISIFRIDLI